MIYGFALSSPDGLIYRRNSNHVGRLHDRSVNKFTLEPIEREWNQLQYVCHELRNETRTLGMRHNDVYFKNFAETAMFIRSLPASMCQYLRTVHVLDGSLGNGKLGHRHEVSHGLQTVREFCVDYPHITVRAHDPALKLDEHSILHALLLMPQLIRGRAETPRRVMTAPGAYDTLAQALRSISFTVALTAAASLFPENLRLCLHPEFDEAQLRKTIANSKLLTNFIRGAVKGGINEFVETATAVYEEGF